MEVTQDISQKTDWNLFTRITFRFFFVYLFLNIFPFPFYYLGSILEQDDLFSFYTDGAQKLSVWVGKKILGIDYEIRIGPNGSGDTTADYIFQFITVMIGLITTILWSIIDYRKKNYTRLFTYFRVFVRYYVIAIMFSYGFSKVFTLQFSELSLIDLIKPFGNSSPMGLMWNFMEYSDTYTRFSGYAEVIAGALLLFRKTTVLGSLMVIAVMFNVFMMNMSYDIPVKLYSGLLTIMGVFLLAPDINRILNFFILNKEVQPKKFKQYFSTPKLKITAIVVKILVVGYLFYTNINGSIEGQQKWGKDAPKSALYGIYEVTEFIKNNDTIPPLTTDTKRWKRLVVDKYYTGIQTMDEKLQYKKEKTDTLTNTLHLTSYRDSTDIQNFTYKLEDSLFIFESIYKGDTLKIKTSKREREEFLLINRGFHWINEFPFNR
ncbi:hypothetical protein [Aquimarina sp. 2201CG5-10]|uniref:hypothetical protein n=1 Tax=Aquimarina callyspongiae TaxID=3098150 RepID=UPI002AB3E483|nr:hypothetical protein [Aquimarina sp. 2201CG5-10]MDY8134716.1 hypothetical protein [Aquimarina sp. 2201CG5-10]